MLIRVWNPVEELKTVIRRLGLRSHPQSIPSLHSDSGLATELVWPFDDDMFDMVICEALGGWGRMRQATLMFWLNRLSPPFWVIPPLGPASSALLPLLPCLLSLQGQTKPDRVEDSAARLLGIPLSGLGLSAPG